MTDRLPLSWRDHLWSAVNAAAAAGVSEQEFLDSAAWNVETVYHEVAPKNIPEWREDDERGVTDRSTSA